MKSIYSKRLMFVLAVLSLFFLTACGESKAKTDKEILQDIIDSGKFVEYTKNSNSADYTIEISNRMTTPEDKIDTMDFDVHLLTDFAEISYSGYIEYKLYNDGWGISSLSNGQYRSKYLEPIDDSEIYAFLDSYEQNDERFWGNLGSWSTYEIIGKELGYDITYEIEFDGIRTKEIFCYFEPRDGTWRLSTYTFN